MNYRFNSGMKVRLSNLIKTRDITDKTEIKIYDKEGKLLAMGNWFQDQILNYSERWGHANKIGDGPVRFWLA